MPKKYKRSAKSNITSGNQQQEDSQSHDPDQYYSKATSQNILYASSSSSPRHDQQSKDAQDISGDRIPKYDSPSRLRSGTNPGLAGMRASPRTRYANMAYRTLAQEEAALVRAENQRWGGVSGNLQDDQMATAIISGAHIPEQYKYTQSYVRSSSGNVRKTLMMRTSTSQSSQPNEETKTNAEIEIQKLFQGMIEDHAGMVRSRCSALEQNCQNLQSSRREIATQFKTKTDKLSNDIQTLQKRNAQTDSQLSLVKKNNVIEKQSLKNQLLESNNSKNKTLATLKHNEKLANDQITLKNQRIDQLTSVLQSLTHSSNSKDRDSTALRIQLENLKIDLERLNSQQLLSHIFIADLQSAQNRARLSERTIRSLRDQILLYESESASKSLLLQQQRDHIRELSFKLKQQEVDADLQWKMMDCVIWIFLAQRFLTDNKPGLAELKTELAKCEEDLSQLDRLTQSHEPERKAKLTSDIRWCRSRTDDIQGDTTDLEQQFIKLRSKADNAWENPRSLESLRGKGKALISDLTEFTHITQQLMQRTGKTRDDIQNVKNNLKQLQILLVQVYGTRLSQKLQQIKQIMGESSKKQDEIKVNFQKLEQKLKKKNQIRSSGRNDAHKLLIEISNQMDQLQNSYKNVSSEFQKLEGGTVLGIEIQSKEAQLQHNLIALSDLLNKKVKDSFNISIDNLRESDLIHANVVDCIQKVDAICNNTLKQLIEKMRGELDARGKDYNSVLNQVKELENSQTLAQRNLQQKISNMNQYDEQRIKANELHKFFDPSSITQMRQKLKNLETKYKEADFQFKKLNPKGSPGLGEVIHAHDAIEKLNTQCDLTSAYISKIQRQYEPMLEEVQDLDTRIKLEQLYSLQNELFEAQDESNDLNKKLRECDELKTKAESLREQLESAHGYGDAQKHGDVNNLAAALNGDSDELQRIKIELQKWSEMIGNEQKIINSLNNDEVVSQERNYFDTSAQNIQKYRNEIERLIGSCSSLKRGLEGGQVQAMALERKYDRKRVKVNNCKRMRERVSVSMNNISANISSLNGRLGLIRKMIVQDIPPHQENDGRVASRNSPSKGKAADQVRLGELHESLKQHQQHQKQLQKECNNASEELRNIQSTLNKIPREIISEKELDNYHSSISSLQQLSRRLRNQIRDIELWITDSQQTLEPILKTLIGNDDIADAKLLFLQLNRQLNDTQSKLLEFNEGMQTFPTELDETKSQSERNDTLLKQSIQQMHQKHIALSKILQTSAMSVDEQQKQINSLSRQINSQAFFIIEKNRLFVLRNTLDKLDARLRETSLVVGKGLRQFEALKEQLNKVQRSFISRQEKVSEMLLVIERVQAVRERLNGDKLPKMEEGIADQLALCQVIGTSSGNRDYQHEYLIIQICRSDMLRFQEWKGRLMNQLKELQTSDLIKLHNTRQNAANISQIQAKQSLEAARAALGKIMLIDMLFNFFNTQIEVWRDCETDFRIPTNLQQRDLQVTNASDKIGYIEHQIQGMHESKARMAKLGCDMKTDLESVREKSEIALQNDYRKKIDELKEKILKLINNAKQHDFMTEKIPVAIPFITQLTALNGDFLTLDAQLNHSIKDLESAKVRAAQIIKDQEARIASSNNFQMRDMQQRMSDMEKELQQLRKKNQFLNLMQSIVGPCDINLRSLEGAKRDIEQSNKRLVIISDHSKNRQQQRCMNLTSEGASAQSSVSTLDEDIHQLTNKINPLKQAIQGVDFSQDTSSERVRQAIANLIKMVPNAKSLDERTKKLTTRGGIFRSDVNSLESRLLQDFRKQLELRTGSDQSNLNKNGQKLVQCNNLSDKLGENIAQKLSAIDPNSVNDLENFNSLRLKLGDKVKLLRACEKKQFRTEAENKRLREKLDYPLPLQDIPSMSRAVDVDLAQNSAEIDKNIRATDALFDQLRIMQKDYTIAENGLARSKLDQLEERMAQKKKEQRDMDDKLVDIDRELNLLLANLDQSRKAASDNPELRKRLDAMEMLIRDKHKREHARLRGEHDKLAHELSALDKKLDKERTNPTVAGLLALGKEIKKHDQAFDIVMEDIENLKDKVTPLTMEMGEIQRNFGDLLFQVERSIKLGTDDLRDLAKRLKEVQRVLSEVDSSRKSLAKDGFKDAQKRRDLQGFARSRELPLLNGLKSLNTDKDSLTQRLDNFRSRLDQHSKSSANKRLNMQQIAKLAREARNLDQQIRSKQSEANELLSNAELCRDDMKQLVTSYEKKAQEYSDTLAEAQDCRTRLNSVDTAMDSLRSRLITLSETISDTPKAKSQQSLLVRDQLMRDAQSLRVKINDANNMQQQMRNDYELHTKDLPQIETKIITVLQLKSKREQLRKLNAKLLQFEKDLAEIDRKMKLANETAENQHRRQKNEQLYDVERRAKNQEEELKRADGKLQKLGVLLNDLQRDAENEQRTNPNNPIMYDSMRDLLNEIMHIKNSTPQLSKEHSTLRTIVGDILNQLTLLSPRTINPESLSKFSDSLDDVEPRTAKLHSDIDGLLKLGGRLNDRVIHAKQDAADRIEKNNKLLADLGKSQQCNQNLKSNLSLLKELIDDIRLIAKAMTHNPDYEDDIGDVGNLTSKLNKSEMSYENISKEYATLTLRLEEILRAEKTFATEDEPVIQEYLIAIGEILPLLESYEAQTDELIQSLKKKRAKMGDLKIPENIEKRKHEGLELQHCVNECENQIKQLSEKLKYHDEFCDLPGERDDMIRDMVRKDVQKGSTAVAEARVSRESALRDLAKVNNSLEGKNLLILSGHDSHKPILTIAQIGQRLRKTLQNLKDVILQLSSGKDNLGDLDVEKKMFDMETEMKDIDSNILNIKKDLELLEEVIDVLENDYEDKDQEKLHLVLKHDVDIISANCQDLSNDSKILCRDFDRMRGNLERSRGDNQQMMLLIRELNTLDARTGKNRAKLHDTEKLLNKSKDRVAGIDLEAKQKVRNNQMSHITLKIEEGNRDIQELRQFAEEQVNEPNDYQQQIAELEAELQTTSVLYQELTKQKVGLKNDLNKIADVLKALKKPRNFYQVQPPYVGYKHVGKRIRWILSKLLQFDKRVEKTKNAREKIINSKQRINYKAQKGDPVDRMLADFLNAYGCPVPITRIGGGFYMFGTRKIYAKIINGRLVIRVGGGYMNIEEFVAHHAQQELMKMQLAQTKSIEFENSPRNQRRGSKMPRKSVMRPSSIREDGKFEDQKSMDGRKMTKSTSAGNVGRVTIQQPEDLQKRLREWEQKAAQQGEGTDWKAVGSNRQPKTPR